MSRYANGAPCDGLAVALHGFAIAFFGEPLQNHRKAMQSYRKAHFLTKHQFPGGHGEEETPVPIPNTAVKLLSGGSSWRAISRKISALPGLNIATAPRRKAV